MRKKNNNKRILFLIITIIILFFIFSSVIIFGLGYFGGWLAKITIGSKLVEGLNLLFNTDYFTKDMLPIMGGTLSWMSSFFKDYNFDLKKKD